MVKVKRNSIGGAATVMPLQYYNTTAVEPSANAGQNLLKAIPPLGIRPRIGGKRRKTKKSKGGFVPSIMDGFVASASQYIVPVALFAGYKLLSRKNNKSQRRTKKFNRPTRKH
jgi:hypothetical protein